MSKHVLLASLIAAVACSAPEHSETSISAAPPKVDALDTEVNSASPVAAERGAVAVAPTPIRQPRLPAPRTPFAAKLTPLWTKRSFETDSQLVVPNDLMYASSGLLTFDVGDRTVHVFEPSTGRYLRRFGREGSGPGEFSRSMWFQGTYDAPVLFDAIARRLTTAFEIDGELKSRPLVREYSWISTCALDDRTTIGTVSKDSQPEFMVVREGKLVDSLSTPWPELHGEHLIVRQAITRQIDASTCAFLTLYQPLFATYSESRGFLAGRYVEDTEVVVASINILDGGKGRSISLPGTAVSGAYAAGGWRDHVMILYGGRTPLRMRLLDLYRREDLSYAGSIVLPFKSRRLAIRGDTLAVIGDVDDYPVLATFLLTPSR